MNRRDELRTMMDANAWEHADVAKICEVSEHTVTSWLRPASSKAARTIPPGMLRLLRIMEAEGKRTPRTRRYKPK